MERSPSELPRSTALDFGFSTSSSSEVGFRGDSCRGASKYVYNISLRPQGTSLGGMRDWACFTLSSARKERKAGTQWEGGSGSARGGVREGVPQAAENSAKKRRRALQTRGRHRKTKRSVICLLAELPLGVQFEFGAH